MLSWLWLSLAVVCLDQLTKWLALAYLDPYAPLPLMPGLNFTLTYNTGAAFSFLSEAGGWQRWFLSALALGVSAVIVYCLWRLAPRHRWPAASLALVLGGAIGNLIDRLVYGHVVDFIDLYAGSHHWPTFNVADSAITLGAIILIAHALFVSDDAAPKAC